jgi:signal transduction histidine kinase
MEESATIGITEVILIAMLAMFLLSMGIVFFFLAYQRRILRQQKEHQVKEAEYQQQLMRANLLSQEKERNRIGKDLHDSVGSMLTTARLYFKQIKKEATDEQFDGLKTKALEILDETMTSVRRVSHDLKPVVLEEMGLAEAISNMVDQINDSGQIHVDYEYDSVTEMDKEYELNWFRIVQELVNNTLKHSGAQHIIMRLSIGKDKALFQYEDDGKGMNGNTVSTGLGLKNIESRLQLMQGKMTLNDPSGAGISLSLNSDVKPLKN